MSRPPGTTQKEEIASFPRWAVVAYAGRVARRALCVFKGWSKATASQIRAVSRAITLTERGAAAPAEAIKHTNKVLKAAVDNALEAAAAAQEANVLPAAAAARSAMFALGALKQTLQGEKDEAVKLAKLAIRESATALGDGAALRQDLNRLAEAAVNWNDATPVPQKVFGKLPPIGTGICLGGEENVIVSRTPGTLESFSARKRRIDNKLASERPSFEKDCTDSEGTNLLDLGENQCLASIIQEIADRLQVAFRCPKCGQPARFRCVPNNKVKTGVFVFAHSTGPHGGTAALPKLILTEPAEDGRKTLGRVAISESEEKST